MAIIKCKMCGGDLILEAGSNVAECAYCGSRQTVPSADNEKKLNLFARANRLRANNEFDKAAGVYESIVADFPEEAEAYWGLILCKYGIEYVDDPGTGKKIPTCHRSSFDSLMDDQNFELVMEYADPIARRVYREEAKQIEELRKGIIEVSSREEPYDIFICYKETDEKGDRTLDSVLAQDVYDMLTENGYRVFFSRVTLEDKLGQEYEPYIFAALNSAKIMLAFGTDYDYYNAVWVKNEWSRFLQLIAKGEKKTLIPCYKNIDAYDMPKEFAKLQAQDLGKVGAMQDLLRGIKKILPKEQPKAEAHQQVIVRETAGGGPSTANLLRRGNLFLEERNWASAEEYFNKVLDIEAENGSAYLGLVLAKAQCPNTDDFVRQLSNRYKDESVQNLIACEPETKRIDLLAAKLAVPGYLARDQIKNPFDFSLTYPSREAAALQNKQRTLSILSSDRNYARAKQYADAALKDKLDAVERKITAACDQRIESAKRDAAAAKAETVKQYQAHLNEQEQAAQTKSSNAQNQREEDYNRACVAQKKAFSTGDFLNAEKRFRSLFGYKDASERADQCAQERTRLQAVVKREAERKAKKKKRNMLLTVLTAVLAVAAFFVVTKIVIPNNKYNAAVKLYEDGKYEEAITAFEALDGYKDSAAQIEKCETAILDRKYDAAMKLYEEGKYEEAITAFNALNGHKDSSTQITKCENAIKDQKYNAAVQLYENGKLEEAITAFKALNGYKDSAEQIVKCETAIKEIKYAAAVAMKDAEDYEAAITAFKELGDYKDSAEQVEQTKLAYSKKLISSAKVGDYVIFGSYEQDNDSSNGKEDIEWLVLAKKKDRILVISKYALDCQKYHSTETSITWGRCSLRTWLNGTFYNTAFEPYQKKMIISSEVSAENNPYFGTSAGNNTTDKVFLLSITEVKEYFSSDNARSCHGTKYCYAQGLYENSTGCCWWLRTPGITSMKAILVDYEGHVPVNGRVNEDGFGVRPALWINLGS